MANRLGVMVLQWMLLMLCTLLMLCALGLPCVAAAQDMTFGLEETGSAPAASEAPSISFVRGVEAYGQKRYAEAAVQLQQVVSGQTADSVSRVQQAQLALGKALLHLGFNESALRSFDEITRVGREHPQFAQTLSWLAELANRVADPSTVAALVGRFEAGDLTNVETAVRDQLLLMMGRDAYERRELPLAIELLQQIEKGTPRYVHAQLLIGVSHVRARHARPAVAAFREVLRALESGDGGDVKDRAQMQDLAWLSLGRIYYAVAHSRDDANVQGQALGSAVDAWSRVSEGGPYSLDALFESSWALFVSDQHARALGNIHGLLSPYFANAFYPEAHVIKAVAFFHSCQMDNASAAIRDFHDRYAALQRELATLPRRMEGDGALSLVSEVLSGELHASNDLRSLLTRTLGAQDVRRAHAQLDALRVQQVALRETDATFRNSALGARIEQDLQAADALVHERVSALVRARVARSVVELQEISNQIDTVEIEILNWQRETLDKPPVAPRDGGGEVKVDSEHVVWPFNGEYWRDELPYYRQQVTNRCAR